MTVGRKMSRAQYYVDEPKDVKRLLMVGTTRPCPPADLLLLLSVLH